MAIEIEKKYRLTRKQWELILCRLPEIHASFEGTDFEENTLYKGEPLDLGRCVLRLRRVGDRAVLTYKERFPSASPIKHQREDETAVDDPEALKAILEALGLMPALVYEKRRQTWRLEGGEISMDELPFGLFMEIEAGEDEIGRIEQELGIEELVAEEATYPQLAYKHGILSNGIVEARF